MKLFSKRNLNGVRPRYLRRHKNEDEDSFLSEGVRVRLIQELKFISNSEDFLERFLLVFDENSEKYFLSDNSISKITKREVGYDISDFINLRTLEFKTEEKSDTKFFDLLELILIFAKEEKRGEIINRFNQIFKEEDCPFKLHSFMIVGTDNRGLRSITPFIQEELLREKITDFYKHIRPQSGNELGAKTSSEIVQLIFSSPISQDKTKQHAEKICKEVASKWTDNKKDQEKLTELLNETVLNVKKLSNEISNIRHTDRTTIPVDNPDIYKLIAMKNINIAELVILSLPEKFVMEQDPEKLKDEYIEKFNENKSTEWVIKKEEVKDIPF